MLLSWLMSSISLEILSLVVNSKTSLELWISLEQQFGSETFAKKVHLKIMLNNLRKGAMSMTEFFGKLKTVTDELVVAGSPVSSLDFLTHLISGLGQPYYPVVVYIEANLAKMSINEAYSMLLTHEARLEANQLNSSKEAKMNFAANVAQTGQNTKSGQYNANWNKNQNGNGNGGRGGFGRGFSQGQVRGNWNGNWNNGWNGASPGNYQGKGGFGSGNGNFAKPGGFHNSNGRGSSDLNSAGVICQIYFKPKHTAAECRNKFNREFIPFNSSSGYNSYQYPVPRPAYANSAPRAAFVAASEGDFADQGWYIDSGATHHLTNNLQNLSPAKEYSGNHLLHDGNGQGLHISHVGYTDLHTSLDSILHLKDILFVPHLTKNLISISKLLQDNNLTIEFVANMCFIKDQKKGVHLAQGIARGGLYQLLSKKDFTSSSHGPSQIPSSMLSVLNNSAYNLLDEATKKTRINNILSANLLYKSFGHPSKHVLKCILSSLSLPCPTSMPDFCDACQYGKIHQFPFYSTGIKTKAPLELVHTDLWGPTPIPSLQGYRYYISFVDDHSRPYSQHKFNFHTQKCLMIGYNPLHKGYKCLDPTGKTYIARHVKFNESEFPYSNLFPSSDPKVSSVQQSHFSSPFITSTILLTDSNCAQSSLNPPVQDAGPDSGILQTLSSSHSSDTSSYSTPHQPSSSIQLPSVSTLAPQPAQNIHPMLTRSKAGVFKPKTYLAVTQHLEPHSVKAALADFKWRQAMVKYNPDGSISKYKARLVAKGFHQTQGVDFFETFSLVVKPCTKRIILSLAVMNHWLIRQLDINNAFLNGILTEEVFMHQPEGFIHPQFPSHVYKLTKALYGLKQAPRAWYDRLKFSLLNWGFIASKSDTSLFIFHKVGDIVVILVYVDDILVTGSNDQLVEKVIHHLSSEFALKDLGEFNYFLGLEVTLSVEGLHLSQTKYVGDILKKAQMIESKGCSTPMSSTEKLVKDKGAAFENPSLYRSIVGSLQYLTLTRLEIAFTVNKLSQFLANPSVLHWQACKRVLRYLQCTADLGLQFYASGSLTLSAFSDADWGSDLDDRNLVGGYCIYLGNNLVSWSSKKQPIVSRSIAESEYRALVLAVSETLWITYLLQELKVTLSQTPVIYCDNKSKEALASNPKYHSRTKHIELDLHFIRDHIGQKELQISHVPSYDQVADIFTKPLAFDQFNYLRSKLNVLSRP
ncbi:retrovirus-related pol polyprotein from transposon RE1 [Citrus sinensis]|uniref:Retrovirus-related pol polyprotein from transposon RE1 n=1 Tax=Citrus sinensis TaxID=2711 RepID=A0ACB8IQ83_CITSI|nr:retrovirus-related pol polyprotein from transposon RE1 [Citrus sinensis]